MTVATKHAPVWPPPRRQRRDVAPVLRGLGGVVALAVLIQAVAGWGPASWQVPGLGELAAEVSRFVAGDPEFTAALLHTVRSVLLALLVALVAGVAVGVTVGLSPAAYRAVIVLLELVRPIPAVAVIPLAILALGQGQEMEIAVTAFAAWWPLLFNPLYGVRNIEPMTVDTARAFGLGRTRIILRVVLPATLPMVVTGLRIAAPLALIVAVGAEYLATAGEGLGGVLIEATSTGDLQVLWAAAVVTGIMGLGLGGLVWLVGRIACPWSTQW